MRSMFLLAGAGAFAMMLCGCAPELDQTGLSPEEKIWAENIKANYGAWEIPESVPRGVRRDDVNNVQNNNASANAGASTEVPAAMDQGAAPAAPVTAEAPAAAAANGGAETAAPAAVENPAPATTETYTVVKGDTLGAIARKYYGRASAWKKIADANADLLKGKTLIRPGMKLQIPRP